MQPDQEELVSAVGMSHLICTLLSDLTISNGPELSDQTLLPRRTIWIVQAELFHERCVEKYPERDSFARSTTRLQDLDHLVN